MSSVKVGVVGVGVWGRNIVRALKELEEEGLIEVVGVADVNVDRALEVANIYGIKAYVRNVREITELGAEAVVISVPINELFNVARDALSLGLHALIEKPVSTRSEEIAELIRIAESSSLIAQPGFIVRYDPGVKALKKILKGKTKYLILKRLSARPTHRRKYSVVLDLMIHDIDLALNLINPEESRLVNVLGFKREDGLPQEVHATLLLDDVVAHLITDGALPVKIRCAEVVTEDTYYEVSFTDSTLLVRGVNSSYVQKIEGEEPLKAELRDFIRSIEGHKSPEAPTLQDALRALKLVELIEQKLSPV
ncbi:MAG: Gfo/Idh/MocA family oxidoreductase [Desulfurococcaceae archaeon TW002]